MGQAAGAEVSRGHPLFEETAPLFGDVAQRPPWASPPLFSPLAYFVSGQSSWGEAAAVWDQPWASAAPRADPAWGRQGSRGVPQAGRPESSGQVLRDSTATLDVVGRLLLVHAGLAACSRGLGNRAWISGRLPTTSEAASGQEEARAPWGKAGTVVRGPMSAMRAGSRAQAGKGAPGQHGHRVHRARVCADGAGGGPEPAWGLLPRGERLEHVPG